MPYRLDTAAVNNPSLETMVSKAIDILQTNENRFFLFVESALNLLKISDVELLKNNVHFIGALIDSAHYTGRAAKALNETAEFSKAIELARRKTSIDDTLVVVTSDHSHTMSISGYSVQFFPNPFFYLFLSSL